MRGNAEGSTLRLTLGCLLGFELRRIGSGDRRTFAHREAELSDWMDQNAAVCWTCYEQPWRVESEVISSVSLPLNLENNEDHPFYAPLSDLRDAARQRAKELPIWMPA